MSSIAAGRTVACPTLIEELAGVLSRPKIRRYVSRAEADAFVGWIATSSRIVPNPPSPRPICRDPDDDYLVALAIAEDAVLVTGDHDLLAVAGSAGCVVFAPREYAELL